MDAREILTRCRQAAIALREIEEQMAVLEERGMTPDVAGLYEGLAKRQAALAEQYAALGAAARDRIGQVGNVRDAVILLRYYVDGQTDRTIAAALGMSREYVNRRRLKVASDMLAGD